ncbi:hypothetical protein [Billgrantia desiderata]|uniref:Uncharacterized protein n=1 Tax=Billgrantia desiderata TaxID=52021 RepID=A0AAW4YVT2_9GAMM|nr:hypothetical protein [Halomonas desiderata]MCE8014300.1 hypothetical protein [Halomonas desiderata]MCE8051955.1 hypothetical protein [Halomonas desiderata]NIC38108.1 hypothetical protein [Halomonas desiderata]OUE37256.1 hypothetical protein BZY95_21230 [Halomonas desiderata SP1]SEG39356.1 hypothetical protein SAMN04487953_12841 [Halomonas desiderata]
MKTMTPYSLVPLNPAAMMDVWKLGLMALELWSTSLSTITMRHGLWQTQSPTSARMLRENQRMVTEKLEAGLETGFEMQKAMLQMAFGQGNPWWHTGRRAMAPYHRRSSANSRRLARRR